MSLKNTAIKILLKLGAGEESELKELSEDRVGDKLAHRISKGIPVDVRGELNGEEIALIRDIGYNVDGTPVEDAGDVATAVADEPEEDLEEDSEGGSDADPETNDDPDEGDSDDVGAIDEGESEESEEEPDIEKAAKKALRAIGKSGKKGRPRKGKARKVAKKAPVKSSKANKVDKAAAIEKPEAENESESPARKTRVRAPKGKTGADVFLKLLNSRKSIPKADLLKSVIAAGATEATARAYTVWSKRNTKNTNPAKGGNRFGILIEEFKDKNGLRLVRKIGVVK